MKIGCKSLIFPALIHFFVKIPQFFRDGCGDSYGKSHVFMTVVVVPVLVAVTEGLRRSWSHATNPRLDRGDRDGTLKIMITIESIFAEHIAYISGGKCACLVTITQSRHLRPSLAKDDKRNSDSGNENDTNCTRSTATPIFTLPLIIGGFETTANFFVSQPKKKIWATAVRSMHMW